MPSGVRGRDIFHPVITDQAKPTQQVRIIAGAAIHAVAPVRNQLNPARKNKRAEVARRRAWPKVPHYFHVPFIGCQSAPQTRSGPPDIILVLLPRRFRFDTFCCIVLNVFVY